MRYLVNTWEFIKSPGPMAFIAIVSLIFGIYASLFYEKKPAIDFEVISNTNVYDIHENLGKLDVIYSGQSLRAKKQILKLLTFRIINSGQTTFLKSDYDEADALGFAIEGGSNLELPKFVASSDYLQSHLKPILVSQNEIRISPLIFDAGEFIEVHALVLANEGAEPIVKPLGKLAGVKAMRVIEPTQPKDQRSFWSQVVDANSMWVQIARAPIYMLFGMVLLILVVFAFMLIIVPINALVDYKKKLKRQLKMEIFSRGRALTVADRHLMEKYLEDGDDGIRRLIRILDRISYRNDLVSKISDKLDEGRLRKILVSTFPLRKMRVDELEKEGLVKKEGLRFSVEPDLKRAINQLAEYIGISLETEKFAYSHEDVEFHSALAIHASKELFGNE